jgi:hypothetical protein
MSLDVGPARVWCLNSSSDRAVGWKDTSPIAVMENARSISRQSAPQEG